MKDKRKTLAFLEFSVRSLKEILQDTFDYTVDTLRMKQTQNLEDLEEQKSLSEESHKKNYEPKQLALPLGWDGKPIPVWVYKLHGLGVQYKCEICGNNSYWGRRAFEKHFTEWRHTFGMRSLGIQNTEAFKFITSINDALILNKKLQLDEREQLFQDNKEEECEDNEGTVYKKQDWLDLKAEGIIN